MNGNSNIRKINFPEKIGTIEKSVSNVFLKRELKAKCSIIIHFDSFINPQSRKTQASVFFRLVKLNYVERRK